jgi:hypothetical protein
MEINTQTQNACDAWGRKFVSRLDRKSLGKIQGFIVLNT